MKTRRHDHRHARADAARRRRLRHRTACASTFYTGALQTVTYHIPRYHFRGLPRLHQQAAVRPEARPRHAADAASARRFSSTRSPSRSAIDPAELRLRIVEQPDTLTANYLRVGTIGLAECIAARRRRLPDWNEHVRQAAARPRRRPRLLVVSVRRRPADLLERHAALRRAAASSIAAAASPRSAAPPRSARARTTCWSRCVAEVLGIEPIDVRAGHRRHRSRRRSISARYSSRVTLMMGNAAIQAAERARDLLADAVSRQADGAEGAAGVRRPPRLRHARIRTRGVSFAEAVQPRRSDVRHDRHDRLATRRRRSRRALQRRRRRAVADLLLLRRDRRGRGRSVDRLDSRAARLDRARHRPRAQPDAGARPGRRQRLHGDSAKR